MLEQVKVQDDAELSAAQINGILKVNNWFLDPDSPQIFYFAGFAGVGKTTIAKKIADLMGQDRVAFMAFSGKAAHVMQKKGCQSANTIHSWIYSPKDTGHTCEYCSFPFVLERYDAHVEACTDNPDRNPNVPPIPYQPIEPGFTLNEHLGETWVQDEWSRRWKKEWPEIDLIILDESSMVNEEIAADIESFSIPILVFGDPAQLPPPKGAGYFTERTPDVFLEEIHRQAKDSPIIMLATLAREGKPLPRGHHQHPRVKEEFAIVGSRRQVDIFSDPTAQVICGRNATRRSLNQQMRKRLGFNDPVPMVGEKLICLKNSRGDEDKIFNGSSWIVKEINWVDGLAEKTLLQEDGGDREIRITLQAESFTRQDGLEELPPRARRGHPFDFGYVITAHKAQGSQWDTVIVIDESFCWKREGTDANWRYTAITRAAKKLYFLTL